MATNNPIGSQAPEDFKFNVANIDRAMNSDAATFTSRAASDQPAREQFTWAEIQRRAVVEISAAEQAKIDAQAARDDAQAIAETLAAVKIYRTHALAVADLPNLQDGDNVEINQDETTDGLRTRYVVVSGALADKTILSTVVNATATPVVDTAAWEDVPVLESTPATISAALNTALQKLAKRTRFLRNFSVLKTSATGSAHIPSGPTSARDANPEIGYTRFNTESGQPEIYNGDSWVGFGASGEMFEIIPYNGPVEYLPTGSIPANGQTFYAALYPEAVAEIDAGKQFAVPDAQWLAGLPGNPDAYKGCWSLGGTDENGRWLRAPKLNRDGAYRAPFLRGSEIGVDAGALTDDRIRNILGTIGVKSAERASSGAFTGNADGSMDNSSGIAGGGTTYTLDASRVVPTGPENSPRYHGVIMCIRMFGTVSNPGSVDAAQLATDLAVANAKIATLEGRQEPIGEGQTWQNVLPSRIPNTTYTNLTGRTICVAITIRHSSNQNTGDFKINGVPVWKDVPGGLYDIGIPLFFTIPNLATYSLDVLFWTVDTWTELR